MMNLKLALPAAIFAVLALSGCATIQTDWGKVESFAHTTIVNPWHKKEVAFVLDALGAAGSVVKAYAALPLCPPGTSFTPAEWCHDKDILATVDKAQNVAIAAASDLVQFQEQYPNGSTVVEATFKAKYQAAVAALGGLQGLVKTYKLGGAQ